MLAEASSYLCDVGVPYRAVISSAADPASLLRALRSAGVDDLEVVCTILFEELILSRDKGSEIRLTINSARKP